MKGKILILIIIMFLISGCTAEVNIEIDRNKINESTNITVYENVVYPKEVLRTSFRNYIPIYADDVIVDTLPDQAYPDIIYYQKKETDLGNGYLFNYSYNFNIDEDGRVSINRRYQDGNTFVQFNDNEWEDEEILDTLKIVRFDNERYLKKEGESFWVDTDISGPAYIAQKGVDRPKVLSRFLEMSNVNPVNEMVRMIEVQRAYELNSKTISTHDTLVGRVINEVGRV